MIKFEDEKKKPSSLYLELTPPLYQARMQWWTRDEGSEGGARMQATDQTLGLSPFQRKKSGPVREVGGEINATENTKHLAQNQDYQVVVDIHPEPSFLDS